MPQRPFSNRDALLLVDVQNDFFPGGALPVPDGDAIIPVVNAWIDAAQKARLPILASRDWHPRHHPSFTDAGGPWPIHCLQDTPGAAFHTHLALPEEAVVISKGTRFDRDQYSAFDETGLAALLDRLGVRRLWIAGLALDVCVEASARDACEAGYETRLIAAATRPVTPDGGERAQARLAAAGVPLV